MARARLDAVSAAAVEVARAAAEDVAGAGLVGEHLGVQADGDRLVTHHFESLSPAYVGWRWSVTLARAPRSRVATVCEVDLVSGQASIVAPPWVPWASRLAPGDIGPGDVLPRAESDERLELGFEATGDEDVDQMAIWEFGLGRPRVLSREGRQEAVERWAAGDFGPDSAMAKAARQHCVSCGFLMPLAGVLRQEFGICTNEWSPADGRVVTLTYGCGAHSESEPEQPPAASTPVPIIDDQVVDLVALPTEPAPTEPAPAEAAEPEPASAEPASAEPAPTESADPQAAEPESAPPDPAEPDPAEPESAVDDGDPTAAAAAEVAPDTGDVTADDEG